MNTQVLNNDKVASVFDSAEIDLRPALRSSCDCEAKESLPATPPFFGFAVLALATASMVSCRKDPEALFEVNNVMLYDNSADKTKRKSNEQYVSILFTNLFQSALSSNAVFDLNRSLQSIGDQELAREVLISNFFNDAGVQMPTVSEMNADINAFIDDTYKRFFVRLPSEAERTWTKNFIQSNPFMTPELVYFSFALSNEYLYY